MIETLDIRTLVFVLPIGHAMAAFVLFFSTRKRDSVYDTVFMFSMVFQTFGWLLLFFRGYIPDIVSFSAANTLIFCGFGLESLALISLVRPVERRWKRFIAAVLALAVFIIWLPLPGQNLSVGLVSFVVPFFFVFPGIFLIRSSPHPSPLQKFLGAVILFYVVAVLARGIYTLAAGSYSLTTPSFFQAMYVLLQIAMLALASTGYVLIRREFAYADLETDIAEREQAEEALRENEEKYRKLFEQSNDAIFIANAATHRILDCNRKAEALTGYSREKLLALRADDLHPESARTEIARNFRAFCEGTPGSVEAEILTRDGRLVPVSINAGTVEIQGVLCQIGIVRDISWQKEVQKRILEKTEEADQYFRTALDLFCIADTNGYFLHLNPEWEKTLGWPVSVLEGKRFLDYVHPDDLSATLAAIRTLESQNNVTSFVNRYRHRDGTYRWIEWRSAPKGTRVYAAARDITEKKRAEEELFQSRQMLQTVIDTIPQRVFWKDRNLVFLGCNMPLARDAGYDAPSGLIGKDDYATASRELADRYRADDRNVMETGRPLLNYEEPQIKPDGSRAWLATSKIPLRNQAGEIIGVLGTYEDITQRKRMEEALRESEEKYRALFAAESDAFVIVDRKTGRLIDCNEAVTKMYGYTREELIGKTRSLVEAGPDAGGEAENPSRGVMIEQVHRKKDGSIFPVEIQIDTITLQGREVVVAAIRDISRRRQMEQALRESEERLKAIFNSTFQFTGLMTPDGTLLEANETALAFAGVSREEAINRPFWETCWWRGDEERVQRLKQAVRDAAGGKFIRYEVDVQGSGNASMRVDFSLKPVLDSEGKVRLLIPEARDITERMKAETALRDEKQLMDSIIDSIPGIFYLLDDQGRILRTNRNHKLVIGFSAEEYGIRNALDTIAPEDRPFVAEKVREVFEKGYTTITAKILAINGRKIPYLLTGLAMTLAGKRILVGTGIDIAEQVAVQEALKESEEKYRAILDNIQDMVYRADMNGVFTMVSPSGPRLVGLESPDQMVGRPVVERYANPEDRKVLLEALKKNGAVENFPVTLRAADGSIRHTLVNSHFFYDAAGNVQGVEGVIHDVTSLRLAEDALKESEKKFRAIIENIQEMVYRADEEGRFLMVSPAGARLFGFASTDEMLGLSILDLYANPGDREEFLAAIRKNGSVYGYPLHLRARDGTRIYALASSHFFYDAAGNVQGVEGIVHDVTGLHEAEEALRMANRKLSLLSSITRHDIKNQLLALGGYIQLCSGEINNPDNLRDLFSREERIAANIGRQIDFTRDYEDVGVQAPAWQDVALLARDAATALPMQAVRLEILCPGLEIFADPLFAKVFYNLLDNSLRYGGETLSAISIAAEPAGDDLCLLYSDNGTGISAADKKMLFSKGFGKHTGLGLFLSREILAITGISIAETGEPGHGVRFVMTVPKEKFRVKGTS